MKSFTFMNRLWHFKKSSSNGFCYSTKQGTNDIFISLNRINKDDSDISAMSIIFFNYQIMWGRIK